MKKLLMIIFLGAAFAVIKPLHAVDPATMTSAAPKALELAAIWSPHTIKAMQSGGIGLMQIGKATISIFRLPLGILQCTLGLPFGMFSDGVDNCVAGGIAPFELVYQVILFPIRIFSLGTVQ